jgi:hypothetical protein
MIALLRDDAFEAELACVLENELAVASDVLVKLDSGRRLREQRFEPGLACVQRLRPKVRAVEFEQIEGIEQRAVIVLAAVKLVEDGEPAGIATDRLAVDRRRAGPQRRHGRDDQRIALRPVEAAAREQADAAVRLPGDQPITVMLNFMHPLRAGGRPRRERRDARLGKARGSPLRGGGGAEQHPTNMDHQSMACHIRRAAGGNVERAPAHPPGPRDLSGGWRG